MIFLDEPGIHLGMTRLFGRALPGERAHSSRPKNITICLEQVSATMTYDGGTDIHAFITFITKMLVPVLWLGAIVLMDNLNVHLNAKVKN